jgi:anti-sigma factor RsiW
MDCRQSQTLIPSYLDGELSEAQAAPLRKHLLDCQACRAGAQSEKNQKRWFSAEVAVSVPRDFASRVARRAFAGDTGEADFEIVPAGSAVPASAIALARGARPRLASEDPLLRFVLQATAAAALLALGLSFAIRSLALPAGSGLRAADGKNEITVEQALEKLERMNRTESSNGNARGAASSAPESSKTSGTTRP